MTDLNTFLGEKKVKSKPTKIETKSKPKIFDRKRRAPSLEGLDKGQILELLKDLMVTVPGFSAYLAWTRQHILPDNPAIHPEELADELSIPLLEAYVILDQLRSSSDPS